VLLYGKDLRTGNNAFYTDVTWEGAAVKDHLMHISLHLQGHGIATMTHG
jgi:hypothetical protein